MTSAPEAPHHEGHQPMFNLPSVVIALVGLLIAVQAATALVLDMEGRIQLALWFGFVPARFFAPGLIEGGALPLLWTPLTYAFLHAGWEHVLLNSAWLVIFGTPVAQRYGAVKFLIVFAVSAIVAAAAFALGFWLLGARDSQVLVGASGGISGLTGVALRFVFQPIVYARDPETEELIPLGRKLASWAEMFTDVRARTLFIFWVALNVIVPLLPLFTGMTGLQIAWEAHLGGFFAGLFMAPLLEWPHRAAKEQNHE